MICFPNAKLNLGLNIVSKRPDGYHNIETIFYPIPIKDALEIIPAEHTSFHAEGIVIDARPEDNLVMKALRLLKQKYQLPEFSVHLLKKIPFGAGLGGGSADAAFLLKLVNIFCDLNIPDNELEQFAARLGADCPFFIRNQPVFASGTGNIFESVSFTLKGYYLCLVKPDIKVSTPLAYSSVIPQPPVISLKEIIKHPIEQWKDEMINDFEKSVFEKFPDIKEIKNRLYREGAIYACMSGSGSSVFGLFNSATDLKDAFPSCFVWEGELE